MEENNGISQVPAQHIEPTPAPTTEPVAAPTPTATPPVSSMAKLPGISALFSQAWSAYTARFKTSILLQLSMFGIGFAAVIVGALAFFAGNAVSKTVGIIILIIVGLVLFILVIYFSIWLQTAQIALFTMNTEEIGFKNAINKAKPLMRNFFWTSLVTGLVIMGGFLLLIIPGIILSVLLTFGVYIAVAEGRKIMDSITASREYVRGYWWPVFGRIILMIICYVIAYFIVAIIAGIISAFTFSWVGGIVNDIFSIIIAPLLIAVPYTIYTHLKNIKGQVASPTEGRWKYITLAVIGGILIPLMLIASVTLLALNSARGKARDAKRMVHVSQILSGIEKYYQDKGSFPTDLSNLKGSYLTSIPLPPTPPDGTCTQEQNQYIYKLVSPEKYTLEYCLGADLESALIPEGQSILGHKAGVNKFDSDSLLETKNPPPSLEGGSIKN